MNVHFLGFGEAAYELAKGLKKRRSNVHSCVRRYD